VYLGQDPQEPRPCYVCARLTPCFTKKVKWRPEDNQDRHGLGHEHTWVQNLCETCLQRQGLAPDGGPRGTLLEALRAQVGAEVPTLFQSGTPVKGFAIEPKPGVMDELDTGCFSG
jgi:hypothetical protein